MQQGIDQAPSVYSQNMVFACEIYLFLKYIFLDKIWLADLIARPPRRTININNNVFISAVITVSEDKTL